MTFSSLHAFTDETSCSCSIQQGEQIYPPLAHYEQHYYMFRLNTIMDSNRVMVLDAGRIAEFESPDNLMANHASIFYGMAKNAGLAEAQ